MFVHGEGNKMVYMAKTGTITTINKIFSVSNHSPETIILVWLICGVLPFTQTAGIGSKDMITNGPLLLSSLARQQINSSNYSTSSDDSASNYNNNHYNCAKPCQCEYSSSSQKLEIRCAASITHEVSAAATNQNIDLSPGVRTLRITHAFLVDAKSIGSTVPTLVKNTLVELDLDQVTIEPKSFFANSQLFRGNEQSLRKLTIKGGNMRGGDPPIRDIPAVSIRALLQPLASLQNLDSLNICDSSPSLATVILQAMPAVKHLRAVNNSLWDIPYESLTANHHQYSVIESMDLSKNHLTIIPNGLLEGLTELRDLDVSHNRIFHLQEQVFIGLSALRKLNASYNQIEYVDAEVFTPLRDIQNVDLSHNEVVQFFEPYFGNNKRLEVLNLSNMWVSRTFASEDTATRSIMEIERLISTLHRVETLDISENGMRSIPETLTHAPNLQLVYMDGNKWECTCQDRWFLDWVATAKVSIVNMNTTYGMWCYSRLDSLSNGVNPRHSFYEYMKNLTRSCSNTNIVARTPYKYHAVMGKNKQLNCHAQKPNWPKITWITPSKQYISEKNNNSDASQEQLEKSNQLEPRVSADGSLHLSNVTGEDYGLYLCIASYQDLNITHYVHLGMDINVFRDVRLMSIIVGWAFSFTFLLLVLIFQLVRFILDKLGFRCFTLETTQQTRRVRAFFDSMEEHKTSQLEWLRDNYNMQAKKIKENCFTQLERIRESYSNQSKNLGEFRDYGTQQLYTLRDQYNDQVRRVATYSAHQLCKVRENYVFKRNQVCKFSSHQLLRLRETYKWQAQTLNKILENLPRGLNFDTCRGMGTCGRADSMYMDDFGEEFGCPHHDIQADLYRMHGGNHHPLGFRPLGGIMDKMEHVSLLMPPEFVIEYTQSTAAAAEQPSTPENEEEGAEQRQQDIEDNVVVPGEERLTPEAEDNSTCSTQPTGTLESSTSTSSGSYTAGSLSHPPPSPPENDVTAVTIATADITTDERRNEDV